MALVTLRVLDGADRGKVFPNIPTPVTVGREEGNSIQLNDERVSRFHLKIQEDHEKLVLTDLQSTNGTKVNGESVQLWILRHGDVVAIGRTLLLFGSREEIAQRLVSLRGADLSAGVPLDAEELDESTPSFSLEEELVWGDEGDARATLHTLLAPELPGSLDPGVAAQLSELLMYVHLRIRGLVQTVKVPSRSDHVTLEQRQWQNLVDLQARLAAYLKAIGEPEA
jgi:pSer/pThr/pTyr-binding forkhead associated (FHA) protein